MTRNRFSLLLMLTALLLSVALAGCGDSPQGPETDDTDTGTDPLDEPVICLSVTTCTLDGGTDTSAAINVTNCGNAAAISWSATADSTWVTLIPTSGVTPGSFQIVVESNSSDAVRAATVTVICPDLDDLSVSVAITQLVPGTEPPELELSVSVTTWDAPPAGGVSPEIAVTNTGDDVPFDWLVSTDETWLTLQVTDDSVPGSFTITAAVNESGSLRSGIVTVTAEGVTGSPWEITVEQVYSRYIVGSLAIPGEPYSVFVSGDYAYVAAGITGLMIVDVSAPSAPTLKGSYNTDGYATGVFVSGNYAYVADESYGLVIVNISNPASPSRVGGYNTQGVATNVFVNGDYAYVADGANGLVILNVSVPATPTLTGGFDTDGSANDVFVTGNYAYVADGVDGLIIVNVSDPATPVSAGDYNTSGSAIGIYVFDNKAFIADAFNGLLIVNVSTPSSLELLGRYDTDGSAVAVSPDGDYAYVADEHGGCKVVDISNPSSPSLVASEEGIFAMDVFASGEYVFVADYDGSLLILNFGLTTF